MSYEKPLFTDKYLNAQFKQLELPDSAIINQKLSCISRWKKSILNQSISQSKEESLQGHFLQQFLVEILDYSNQKDSGAWSLETEQKTLDNKKMDGALGFFTIENNLIHADVRVVIELKNAKTDLDKQQNRKDDKRTPVQQAFDYANTLGGSCRWVIVSNFKEIRLYKQGDRTSYQNFDILKLENIEKFKQFYFLLNKDRLIAKNNDSLTDKLFLDQQEEKLAISKEFYKTYKQARLDFFESLKKYHPDTNQLVLLNKTQKLLDRIIFIRFCESNAIIDNDTLKGLIENAKKDKFIIAQDKIIQRLKVFFAAIDVGNEPLNINKFNGGLFREDVDFNQLIIEDVILEPVLKLVDYDFKSDLDVNILGHIFEQSLSDIEELKASISGEVLDKKQGKRKKDGIYYTPDTITKYIVEEAIGGWLKDRRIELNEADLPELTETDFSSITYITKGKDKGTIKHNAEIQAHIEFYQAYKSLLSGIKVLDPACGSGAFLNQAFDFLYSEGMRVNKVLAELMYPAEESQLNILKLNEKLEQHILNDNLFGVDLNQESVEITRLSLWIKTANNHNELTTLDDNIKCGNSLIDDVSVAGNKAFVWENEFKTVMEKGGFDVIIGNPPYVPIESMNISEKNYYVKSFQYLEGKYDTSIVFILKGMSLINKKGYLSYISSIAWQTGDNFCKLRKKIFEDWGLIKIINLPFDIFNNAYVDTCIYIISKEISTSYKIYQYDKKAITNNINEIKSFNLVDIENIKRPQYKVILTSNILNILDKISTSDYEKLGDITSSTQGLAGNKYLISDTEKEGCYPYLVDATCNRYSLVCNEVKYTNMQDYQSILNFYIKNERILIRRIINRQDRLMATYCNEDLVVRKDLNPFTIQNSAYNIFYILALLNSKLLSYIYLNQSTIANKDDFRQTTLSELRDLKVYKADDKTQQPFIEKANMMLLENKNLQQQTATFLNFLQAELKPQKISTKLQHYYALNWDEFKAELKKAKVDLDKNFDLKKRREWQAEFEAEKQKALAIKTLIDQTDKEIDTMVYALYGLDDNDIAIINNGA